MTRTDEQLQRDVSWYHRLAEWGAWAVVAALVAEVFAAFSIDERAYPVVVRWISITANAAIALGVAAEILFGRKASSAQGELQRRTDMAVGEANARAAEARERAARAELELAKLKLPRVITPEQHATIVAALRDRPKGVVHVRPAMLDAEATAYGRQIEAVLRDAEFDVKPWPGQHSMSWSLPGAFIIVRHIDHTPLHALSIQQCFGASGIELLGESKEDHPGEAVSIAIGARP